MKKLFIATLFTAGIGMALISCNNGNYDVNPKTDYTNVKNPLDPNSGVSVYIGTVKLQVNGKDAIFVDCSYSIDTNGIRNITGKRMDDNLFNSSFRIFLSEGTYKGAGTYNIGGGAVSWTFQYFMKDTSVHNRYELKSYYAGYQGIGKGNVTFVVKGDENGNMRGTFEGSIFKATVDQDFLFTGGYDSTDVVTFKQAEYYIPKH